MYAIVETGGKQYYVKQGSKILVEKLDVKPGEEILLDKVLMVGGDECKIGTPYISGVLVKAEATEQGRGPKVLIFKRRRRKGSKTLRGHRQDFTALRIKEIAL